MAGGRRPGDEMGMDYLDNGNPLVHIGARSVFVGSKNPMATFDLPSNDIRCAITNLINLPSSL
jgi:hypothetical protein